MALRDQPYFPLYVDDYLNDEKLAMCSDSTQGLYIKIMCQLHKQDVYGGISLKDWEGQTIHDFAVKFSKLLPRSVEVLEDALNELIREDVLKLEGNFLYQKRMYQDGQKSLKLSENGAEGGKATAKKYFKKEDEKAEETEPPLFDAEYYPFEEFWTDYDKKVGDKDKLKKKWATVKSSDRMLIREYLPKYKAAQPDKKYRKDPSTFLNNKSWNDELIESKPEKKTFKAHKNYD